MRECPCVQLPASFSERSGLGAAPQAAPVPDSHTPLSRPDPSFAWSDAATLLSLLASFNSLTKG